MVKKKKSRKPPPKKALAKTPPKAKIPDLVTGKFVVVSDNGDVVLTPGKAWGNWGIDDPLTFDTKEAANAEVKALEPADGIPDEGVRVGKVEPLGKFLANSYLVDDDGVLSVRLVPKAEAATLKHAAKAALTEQRGYFKELAADLARHRKEIAVAAKETAVEYRKHAASVAEAEKALAKFEAKVAKYG